MCRTRARRLLIIHDALVGDDVVLDPAREKWLRALMRVRDDAERPLTDVEARELDELFDAVGRALVARNLDAYAEAKAIPQTQARDEIMAVVNDAAAFAVALERSPDLMASEVASARATRASKG